MKLSFKKLVCLIFALASITPFVVQSMEKDKKGEKGEERPRKRQRTAEPQQNETKPDVEEEEVNLGTITLEPNFTPQEHEGIRRGHLTPQELMALRSFAWSLRDYHIS